MPVRRRALLAAAVAAWFGPGSAARAACPLPPVDTDVLRQLAVVLPDGPATITTYIAEDGMPTVTLTDPSCAELDRYVFDPAYRLNPGVAVVGDNVLLRLLPPLAGQSIALVTAVRSGFASTQFSSVLLRLAPGAIEPLDTMGGPMSPITVGASGGLYVGDLGGDLGPGVAAWTPLHDGGPGEARRYAISRWSLRGTELRPLPRLETRATYTSGQSALAEFNLDYGNLLAAKPPRAAF